MWHMPSRKEDAIPLEGSQHLDFLWQQKPNLKKGSSDLYNVASTQKQVNDSVFI